eukprot:11181109-Lingulodinium_polyedra.AAC.1
MVASVPVEWSFVGRDVYSARGRMSTRGARFGVSPRCRRAFPARGRRRSGALYRLGDRIPPAATSDCRGAPVA